MRLRSCHERPSRFNHLKVVSADLGELLPIDPQRPPGRLPARTAVHGERGFFTEGDMGRGVFDGRVYKQRFLGSCAS
jgi:hypothetical protein